MFARLSPFRGLTGLQPLIAVLALVSGAWLLAPANQSQAVPVPAAVSLEALNTLIAKLKSQQDLMAANQTKIEAQTALLKEEVRQAKIFAGRAR